MSTRLFTFFVIISLLAGCVFLLVSFRKLQQQKAEAEELCVHLQNKAQEQLNTYQSNLETAILNSNQQSYTHLQISGVFLLNKGVPAVTVKYLEAVKKLF